jgi:hypothetical protein
MTKAMKHLSIATVTVGMLVASMTGAIAEEPATPTQAEGKGEGMGGEMMKNMKEKMKEKMRKKQEKMMGGAESKHATKEQAQAMTTKAADFLKKQGADKAFAAFNAGGDWRDGDLYVFVVDDSGTWVASGARAELVGTMDDRPFIKEIVAVKDKGWVNYKFVSPADGKEHDKSSYIVRVGNNLVGAGAYKY